MSNQRKQNDWQVLYREALLEPDAGKAPGLIEEAYRAAQQRALELWYTSSSETKERHEVDAAIYFLGLLKASRGCKA